MRANMLQDPLPIYRLLPTYLLQHWQFAQVYHSNSVLTANEQKGQSEAKNFGTREEHENAGRTRCQIHGK